MSCNREHVIWQSADKTWSIGGSRNILIGALVAVLAVCGIGFGIVSHTVSKDYSACVVEGKDRTRDADGNSDMRVYTENCGTFSVGDNWFKKVVNSADLYAGIKEGKTYNFEATGWRVGLLSMFPKIYKVEEVK